MFCGWRASPSPALWLTATSVNPIGVSIAEKLRPQDRLRLVVRGRVGAGADHDPAASLFLYWLFPPGVTRRPTHRRPHARRCARWAALSRDEWIVAVAFALMVTGWVMAGT